MNLFISWKSGGHRAQVKDTMRGRTGTKAQQDGEQERGGVVHPGTWAGQERSRQNSYLVV